MASQNTMGADLRGPIFMGIVFSWCLLGTLISQAYGYIITYPDDNRRLKTLVAVLFALELLQTGLGTHYAWQMLVAGWGTASAPRIPWSAASLSIMSGLIAMLVQCFFAWRIWVLRVSTGYPGLAKAMAVLIATIALCQCGAAVYGGIAFLVLRTWEHIAQLTWIVELWLGGSFACDVLIAITMIGILLEASRDSPWKRTGQMVNMLIIHSIETGAITAITALIDLVLYELYKDSSIHQAPALLLGKLYTNALMVSLNGRKRRRESIHLIQQLSMLNQIRTGSNPPCAEDYELSLRTQTTSNRVEGKDPIVLDLPDGASNTNVTAFSKVETLVLPV